jgi:hypothetical protein
MILRILETLNIQRHSEPFNSFIVMGMAIGAGSGFTGFAIYKSRGRRAVADDIDFHNNMRVMGLMSIVRCCGSGAVMAGPDWLGVCWDCWQR